MPYDEVMHKFKAGELHSGSKSGPKVSSRKQAIAIMLSEKRAAQGGKKEYQSKGNTSCESCMGRKVVHKSPPKHPEQSDPYVTMDRMTEQAAAGKPSTLKQARDAMKPAQNPSPASSQKLMDYLKRMGGR